MDVHSGSFKCPGCKESRMGRYVGWKNYKKYNDNQNQILSTYWIFYTYKEKECLFPCIKKNCYFCCQRDNEV